MTRTKQPRKRRTKPAKKQNKSAQPKKKPHNPGKDENNYLFAKGNQLWKLRKFDGREPKYKPEALFNKCIEYFDWEEANPWEHEQLSGSYYGVGIKTTMHRKTPFTLGSLQLYLGISDATWYHYRAKSEYLSICQYAEKVIREQKFKGAAAGYFNHAIIARDLGLVDKKDLTTDGERINNATITMDMSIKDAEKAYKEMLKGGK